MAYTNIDDPSAYFQTKIYTGDGNNNRAITNDGNSDLQPDFIWLKDRNVGFGHRLTDSTRGITKNLASETSGAESTSTTQYASWNTDGFTLIYGGQQVPNYNGHTYVAWQWKANGGTTSSNTDGSITSTVQANTDAGFSIVTATAPSSNGHWSFGHGLGVKPDMVITKQRSGGGWWTWHKDLTNQTTYYLGLNTSSAQINEGSMWGGGMTSSVIGVSSPNSTLANQTYVAYCFASKQGYSKFSKYVGNGNANGTFVYTGFKPEFVIVKRSDSTNNWIITDNARGINGANPRLYADLVDAEGSAADYIDHLSNGFKIRTSAGSMNTSGGTYIYMAFAENPFTTSTGIPATAR